MTLTSPEKIVFEKEKIRKKDIAEFYAKVAPRLVPFLRDRPLSLVRCPSGVGESCFFRRNPESGAGEYITVNDEGEILAEVQLNTIEFHIHGGKLDKTGDIGPPDMMVFDLDPGPGLSLANIRQGVKDLRSILDELNLPAFLKTSGGVGYHVVVPLNGEISQWDDCKGFSEKVAKLMEAKWPARYTTNIRKDARAGKIFVDWLRNSSGATSVAPYSLRAKEGVSVSIPIAWEELSKVAPNSVTIKNIDKYLAKDDPWAKWKLVC